MEGDDSQQSGTADDLVNYMPGMPQLSSEPSRVGQFLRQLLRRRGGLRPVAKNRDSAVIDTNKFSDD
jgi:hypothetical protein